MLMNLSLTARCLIDNVFLKVFAPLNVRFRVRRFSKLMQFISSLNDYIDCFFQAFSLSLCIPDLDGICTKNLIELASKPPNYIINGEEEMGPLDIGYARVSSREQAENTQALEQQIARLKDAGAKHILSDVEKGKKDDRPQFLELMRLVEIGRVRILIITRIDRITRSLPTLRKLVDKLQKHNVILIILDQEIDLRTPQGRLTLNMLGMLAEWEVDLLSERIKHGKEHQRKQRWANGSCPFGYLVIAHKYVLDRSPFLCLLEDRPENYQDFYSKEFDEAALYDFPHRTIAEITRDCVDIFFEKLGVTPTLKAIFKKYGVQKTLAKSNGNDKVLHWTKTGFSLWIRNPVLEGHTCYGICEQINGKKRRKPRADWEILYGTHLDQRLLRDGEAEVIHRIFEANIRMAGGAFGKQEEEHRPYAYQIGLIYCAECGSRAIKKKVYSASREYGYYGCRYAGIGCSKTKNVKQTDIEQCLINAILEKARKFNQETESTTDGTPFKTERSQKLEAQLTFLEEFPGFNPMAEQLKAELQQQIREERNFFQSKQLGDKTVEEIIQAGSSLGVWQTLSGKEKVQIYSRIIHRIFLRNGQVESIIFKGSGLLILEDNHEST